MWYLIVILVILLVSSYFITKWLLKEVDRIESQHKGLYNFHVTLCVRFSKCPGTYAKCKLCVKPIEVLFECGKFRIIAVSTNSPTDINLNAVKEYIGTYAYRFVTKYSDSKGKSFVKDGINNIPSITFPNIEVLVYLDNQAVCFTMKELNYNYTMGCSMSYQVLVKQKK